MFHSSRFSNLVLLSLIGFIVVACVVATEVAEDQSADTFSKACQLVYEGRFGDAKELVSEKGGDEEQLAEIATIANEYEQLKKQREAARHDSYQEKWKKLQNMRWVVDANVVKDTNDANEIRDVNDPAEVFSVAASLVELADEKQKQQVLQAPIVKKAIAHAKAQAAEYEQQGKWFDSYTNCWYWLRVIDEDNEQYEEHSEELVEKAHILGTFQDSPCESSVERFEKVEPEMFVRAIEVIDTTYVSPEFLDYGKMATKALRRSRLLAEVVRQSYSEIEESKNGKSYNGSVTEMLFRPDSNSIAAWNEALDTIEADIKQSSGSINRERFIDIFEQVLLLNSMTVSLPRSILIDHFTEASLSVLDPHTVIVWPKQVSDFKKSLTGEFTGIGILISKEKGLLTAASLLPDTPAYRSGLDAGDIIEAVDGVPTEDMSLECAVKHITGPAGTTVTLTVRTPGDDELREVPIVRAKIIVQTIRGWQRTTTGDWKYMLDEDRKIGYVRLTSFSDNTAKEFEQVLKDLEKEGLQGLILDLRFNPGGLLDSAVDITDKFLDKGLIVRTQPRWGIPDYRSAKSGNTHPDYPLVILVNKYSASASEIVAGALQDEKYSRAVIVGERTHGKGSVQKVSYRPGGGAQLKYTVAYYHLPSGQRVESRENAEKLGKDNWGITPDIEVELIGEEMSKLTNVQRDNDVLVKADHDVESAPLDKHSLEDTLKADPQLKVALLVIRTKLLEQGREAEAVVLN
jgi:carboxyl-terminal processing protease